MKNVMSSSYVLEFSLESFGAKVKLEGFLRKVEIEGLSGKFVGKYLKILSFESNKNPGRSMRFHLQTFSSYEMRSSTKT
jgi:hypothetical protein